MQPKEPSEYSSAHRIASDRRRSEEISPHCILMALTSTRIMHKLVQMHREPFSNFMVTKYDWRIHIHAYDAGQTLTMPDGCHEYVGSSSHNQA
jgi:hypothetical protein